MGRRHSTRRRYRQRAKRGYVHAVLRVTKHSTIATPFLAFLYDGAAMRVELLQYDIQLHGMLTGLINTTWEPLPPDEWPDQVCAFMAKQALIEGKTT